MNTPAHVAVNLLVLGRTDQPNVMVPIVVGAILPDLSMFAFYFWEKVIVGTPESIIWSQSYHQPLWQNLSMLSNSIPLVILGLLFLYWQQSKWGILLFTSMLLHQVTDFLLHSEDAHQHFFPFSEWRFHSPISYWDPNNYGNIVTILEILLVTGCCAVLLFKYQSWIGRLAIGTIFSCYLIYGFYADQIWS